MNPSALLDPDKPLCVWSDNPPRDATRYGVDFPFAELTIAGKKYVGQVRQEGEAVWISLYCANCDKWLPWKKMPRTPTAQTDRSCNPLRRSRAEMIASAQAADVPSRSCVESALARGELALAQFFDALDAASQKCKDLPDGDGLAKAVQAARDAFTRTAVIPDFAELKKRAMLLALKQGQEASDAKPADPA